MTLAAAMASWVGAILADFTSSYANGYMVLAVMATMGILLTVSRMLPKRYEGLRGDSESSGNYSGV